MDLISITRKDARQFEIGVRAHHVSTDLSEKEGGGDKGPTPVEVMAGSLGACIAMMVQSYCLKHGYEGDVGVSMTLEMADSPKRVSAIVIDVELPEGIPADRLPAIRRVAEFCPVHETFKNPPRVDIDIS
ncbi:MAG: OsmC family protein [Pirellulales bacterium]|nr:OsmC family protein [Pirellulales bacterium]